MSYNELYSKMHECLWTHFHLHYSHNSGFVYTVGHEGQSCHFTHD